MSSSKSKPRTWCAARGRTLGLLPGLALAGCLAGCSDSGQPANPAAQTTGGGAGTTTANPTPVEIINANPSSPSIPPAEGTSSTAGGGSATQDAGKEASPATTPDAEPKADAPKVIEKPAEPTPSDKGVEPK